jgi:hypothetical protein
MLTSPTPPHVLPPAALFAADLVLAFRTAFLDEAKQLITHLPTIRRRALVVDLLPGLLGSVPWEVALALTIALTQALTLALTRADAHDAVHDGCVLRRAACVVLPASCCLRRAACVVLPASCCPRVVFAMTAAV